MTVRAFIALGSNLGDRRATIAAAIAALAATPGIVVVEVAEPIETAPVNCPPGSQDFLNTAAALSTSLEPLALLEALHAVERSLGRERNIANAPRTIDLDLLLFGEQIIRSPDLIVPHPRLHERRFVLAPLAAIAPAVIHPSFGKTIAALLREFDASDSSR